MTMVIGNTLSLVVVATALTAIVGATFARELAPVEGVMLWKAGLLALVVFAAKILEAAAPSPVSVLRNERD